MFRKICIGAWIVLAFCGPAFAHGSSRSWKPWEEYLAIAQAVAVVLAAIWIFFYGIIAFSRWWSVLLWIVWWIASGLLFAALTFLAAFAGGGLMGVFFLTATFTVKFLIEFFVCRHARRKGLERLMLESDTPT